MTGSESLYEDPKFPHRQLAALVASKVYYHLGAFEDSMMYALGAGNLFDISGKSEFIDTIICMDIYLLDKYLCYGFRTNIMLLLTS